MSSLPPLFLAEMNGGHWIAISGILGGMTFTILLIYFGLKFVQRRQELWHETARIALEKGQPLPPLPRDMQPERHPDENSDFRTGLIMVATGVGLYLFFYYFMGVRMAFVGAIPGLIGVALLLFASCNALFGRKKTSLAERPPQS
jgi:hypothetical protein